MYRRRPAGTIAAAVVIVILALVVVGLVHSWLGLLVLAGLLLLLL